jgi:hypothetical protein
MNGAFVYLGFNMLMLFFATLQCYTIFIKQGKKALNEHLNTDETKRSYKIMKVFTYIMLPFAIATIRMLINL